MTVVAIWCRHINDNIIGIEAEIPWCIPSDTKRFLDVVEGQTVVLGRKTYESLPNRTIEGSELYVLTSQTEYETSDAAHHHVITKQKDLGDLESDLYVAGGAEVYYLFLTGKECYKPQIVVDCVYDGKMQEPAGEKRDISDSVAVLEKSYRPISRGYSKDNVTATIWVRKGEFVEQSVLKRLLLILETGEN
jgi:dihydrofolate reductase